MPLQALNIFTARTLLRNSIVDQCVGLEDNTRAVANVKACEKRIKVIVNGAREIMPRVIVVHVDCKKVVGFSV